MYIWSLGCFMEGIKVLFFSPDHFICPLLLFSHQTKAPLLELCPKKSSHKSWMSSFCWLSSLPCVQLLLPTQTSWSFQGLQRSRPVFRKHVTASCSMVHGLAEKTTASLNVIVSYLCMYICSVAHLVKHIIHWALLKLEEAKWGLFSSWSAPCF